MFYVVLPLTGAGIITQTTPIARAIVEHLVFGLPVGVAFLPYQSPDEPGIRLGRTRIRDARRPLKSHRAAAGSGGSRPRMIGHHANGQDGMSHGEVSQAAVAANRRFFAALWS